MDINSIKQARERIRPYIIETPLLRLPGLDPHLGCRVYVKAECMQTTGSFKLRGAMNKVLSLSEEEVKKGIVAVSSGNHGRGVAYAAKLLNTHATVVMPDTATKAKVEAIQNLGANILFCKVEERFAVAGRICEKEGATSVPPFDDEEIMAGQGTLGLEIAKQCPDLHKVIVPLSGGGLLSGVSTAIKTVAPEMKVYGAEPAAVPRYSESLKAGKRVTIESRKSVADALVAIKPGEKCFPYIVSNVEQVAAVSDAYILKAMKYLLMEGKLLAEPSSCIGMGAVLQGLIEVKPDDKVCFVISGGNVGYEQLKMLDEACGGDWK